MKPTIRLENENDRGVVFEVNGRTFLIPAEAKLVNELRAGGYIQFSLVAEINGRIVGHAVFSDSSIITANANVPALVLAPLAVVPAHQRQGIGSELVRRGLETCKQQGHRIVFAFGDSHFYRRLGFSSDSARLLESPFDDDAFMAIELVPESLSGISGRIEFPPPFKAVE